MRTKTLLLLGLALGIGALFTLGRRKQEEAGRKRHQDERLDEALAETFPASDPISVY